MLIGYCRCSTEEQSLTEQRRVLNGYALMKGAGSFEFFIIEDQGISGSIPLATRPGGAKLLKLAKPGDTVVATKMDRMFRSAEDALATSRGFKVKGIDLVLTDVGNDPVTGNGTAKLFFTILAGVAEFERERINERIIAGKRIKVSAGGHAGGSAPWGFKVVNSGKEARLAPEEREQECTLKAKELFAVNHSLTNTARELAALGYMSRTNKEFQPGQVARIMRLYG